MMLRISWSYLEIQGREETVFSLGKNRNLGRNKWRGKIWNI
jgi:hypothetical protein